MSVLVNLLPDTRQVKLRERRRRQLFTGIAIVTWIVAGGVLALLTLYSTSQKLIIRNYNNDIAAKKKSLQNVDGLIDAMTAQQHLHSLPALYDQRVYLTKFFEAYTYANPKDVALTSLTLDSATSLTATGESLTYTEAAKLAKALEAVNVTVGKDAAPSNQPYFTNVAIHSASKTAEKINFSITATIAAGVTHGQ